MKRPLVYILIFFIAGIFMGRYCQSQIFLFLAAAAFGTAALYWRLRKNIVLILPIVLLLGFALLSQRLNRRLPVLDNAADNNTTVTVQALLLETDTTQSGKTSALVRTDWAATASGERIAASAKVIIYFDDRLPVKAGDVMTLTGSIHQPDFLRNPGGFDEKQYFRSRGIDYKLYAETSEKTGAQSLFPQLNFSLIRERLATVFDRALPQKEAGIMKALIIGDKSTLDDTTARLYRDAGVYHILAVSGLHVSIVAFLAHRLLLLICCTFTKRAKNEQFAHFATLAFLLLYCLLTGAGVPTVRAVIMATVGIVGRLLKKRGDTVTTTSFAALCLLAYEPFYLWDVGFRYSFIAVYGLAVGTGAADRCFVWIKTRIPVTRPFFNFPYIQKYLAAVVAASAAVTPVAAYHFYHVTPVSILTNLLIVPTVVVVVVIGIFIAIVGLWHIGAAVAAGTVCRFFLFLYESICAAALKLPFTNLLTGSPSIPMLLGIYIVLGCFCAMALAAPCDFSKRKRLFCATAALFLLFCLGQALRPTPFSVRMLDVGQGDGFVLQKDGVCFMIDGGGLPYRAIGNNTGTQVVVPYLDSQGVSELDAAFVTHTDADHTIGLIETMAQKRVKQLFLPRTAATDGNGHNFHTQLIDAAQKSGTTVHYLTAGDTLTFGDAIRVRCLFPNNATALSGNEGALVLHISYGASDFLFTGDIGFAAEKALLSDAAAIRADVLKIAHHGSKYASGGTFLDAVAPKAVLISAGRENTYGHPAPEVLERLSDRSIWVLNTQQSGAIRLESDGQTLSADTMANQAEKNP